MGRAKKKAPSTEWSELAAKCLWGEQIAYELVRPVVLKEQTPDERAPEVGLSKRTLQRKVQQFVQFGIPGLIPTTGHRSDDKRVLPIEVRQHIVLLKAEYPLLTAYEIAVICDIKFGHGSNYRAIQRVLDTEPFPKLRGRRFPRYMDEPDSEQRRHNVIQLCQEGWTFQSIAGYLEVSRRTVYAIVRRWTEEGVAGLADKPSGPKGSHLVTFPIMALIQEYQRNPLIGKQRMHAYLKQQGYHVSPGTCGRIMRMHRELMRQEQPPIPKIPKKTMPFLAERRHQWWSVDIRYIENHQVPEIEGPIYICSILDNYSRAILASAPSTTQDLGAYLIVLCSALALYGAPEGIVSDGGTVFKATKALAIYAQLGIRKERIEPRKPWQNFIETHFGIMRRMADYYFARATSWQEFCDRHAEFIANYNEQEHFAHLDRSDGFLSPMDVLAWIKARPIRLAALEPIMETEQVKRHLDEKGYLQFRYWRLYGSGGLAGRNADVALYHETMTIAYADAPLMQYQVTFDEEATTITNIRVLREFPERYPSVQLHLWELSQFTWRKTLPVSRKQRRLPSSNDLQQLSLFPTNALSRQRPIRSTS
jgi:putative transposase